MEVALGEVAGGGEVEVDTGDFWNCCWVIVHSCESTPRLAALFSVAASGAK